MSDRDSQIYNALLKSTSLDAREKGIAIEAWLLAKRSHDALSSAWAASKEKVRLAENDAEANEYWAKFEGVRAQYALIDKIAQQKEQLARKWRPAEVIYINDDEKDSARRDAVRENDATESSPEAVEIRNIHPQKSVQTRDDMSAGFQASTSALLQLGLDKIVGLDAILGPTGSVRGHQKKQGTKRQAEEIEDDSISVKKNKLKANLFSEHEQTRNDRNITGAREASKSEKGVHEDSGSKKRRKSLD